MTMLRTAVEGPGWGLGRMGLTVSSISASRRKTSGNEQDKLNAGAWISTLRRTMGRAE
jgi:hypothetical protein